MTSTRCSAIDRQVGQDRENGHSRSIRHAKVQSVGRFVVHPLAHLPISLVRSKPQVTEATSIRITVGSIFINQYDDLYSIDKNH